MKIICSANTTEKIMALTFDDGPSQFSSEILRVLKEQKG
ncbi:MAG: polysaccharide deacetylase family protein [Bacteroidetes bacterium]|nr:polysaccharide deacetylase family protein [Bacteroidota bacterium]